MRDRASNSISGRKAKAAGNKSEAWLDTQHEIALRFGILARIDKIDPPAVVRSGRVEFGERTGADYIGMLGSSPPGHVHRYLAVEAKSTEDVRLYKSEVKPAQQKHLDQVSLGGGLALLFVEFRGEPVYQTAPGGAVFSTPFTPYRRYACPWLETPWQVLKTAESVSEIDLMKHGWLIAGECYLERFHPRGTPTSVPRFRKYARE